MKKIKTAVVGVGIFGEEHAAVYAEDERVELAIVCDLNEKRAKEIGKKYNCSWTTKTGDIATNKEIEIVSIATPDFVHRDAAIEMASSGKHIIVEKPLATTVQDAEAIISAAKKAKVKLMVDFHNRWNPPFVRAKEEIEKGNIGKPLMLSGKMSDRIEVATKWFKWSGKSGPHWFLFPHLIDLICWLTGEKVLDVYAIGKKEVLKKAGIDTYDLVQAMLKLENCFATVETSWILPSTWPSLIEFNLSVHGTEGRIDIDLTDQGLRISGKNVYNIPFISGKMEIYDRTHGFVPMPIKHFIGCVLKNKEPLVKPEEALLNVRIIEAITKSLQKEEVSFVKT